MAQTNRLLITTCGIALILLIGSLWAGSPVQA